MSNLAEQSQCYVMVTKWLAPIQLDTFYTYLDNDQRLGQAFCNVLPLYQRQYAIDELQLWEKKTWASIQPNMLTTLGNLVPSIDDVKKEYWRASYIANKPNANYPKELQLSVYNLGYVLDKLPHH